MRHIHTFDGFLNEGTEIEIISMTDAGVSNSNRTASTKNHKDIEAYLSSPDEWTDDVSFKDKQGVVYFVDDLVGKNVKLGGKSILVQESINEAQKSWTRDEVVDLLQKYRQMAHATGSQNPMLSYSAMERFIKENL
jgi:hypothetical protein